MIHVERQVTPIAPHDLELALGAAHSKAFGVPPTAQRLGVAWSHVMLETGRGVHVNNNNFGNVTADRSWPGEAFDMHVPPPDPPVLAFRGYPDAIAGAGDYWKLIHFHYAAALARFDAGDPIGACVELKRGGYFTATLGPYAHTCCLLYNEFAGRHGISAADCSASLPALPVTARSLAAFAILLAPAVGALLAERFKVI